MEEVLASEPRVLTQEQREFYFNNGYLLGFPAGTPEAYVSRIRNEVAKAVQDPEVRRSFALDVKATEAELPDSPLELTEPEWRGRVGAGGRRRGRGDTRREDGDGAE